MIKKADIILLIILVVLGLGASFLSVYGKTAGDQVRVSVDGEVYGIYHLNQNQEIDVAQNGHTNHITIKDGTVSMSYSDCRNQICVHTGAISETKDSIVCLPNRVVVEIISDGNKGGGADVISS